MPAHIRKGLITGAPAFNSGGLGLSIGSRVGGARRMISARAPDGGKMTPAPTEYKIRGADIANLSLDNYLVEPANNFDIREIIITPTANVSTISTFVENTIQDIEFTVNINSKTIKLKLKSGTSTIVETLITKMSLINNYEFKIPTIASNLITETDGEPDTLYYDGETVGTTDADDDKMELYLSEIGYDLENAGELADFKTAVNTYISGKTFDITMTSDRTLKVKSDNLTEVPLALPPPA
jgi:hypothetical protein